MLQKLKSLNMDRLLELEEVIELAAYARAQMAEYEANEVAVPDWLTNVTNLLREEIARRARAALLEELRSVEREIDGYKSVSDRRTDALKRQARLQSRLGLAKVAK